MGSSIVLIIFPVRDPVRDPDNPPLRLSTPENPPLKFKPRPATGNPNDPVTPLNTLFTVLPKTPPNIPPPGPAAQP